MQNGLTIQNEKNSLHWYHINGAHMPYTMTRDIKPVPEGRRSTLYEQSVGALKIATDYLQLMKKLNIYNNATILILSDHGTHSDTDTFHEVKALPLVLVKQPNDHGKLKISKNPVSFSQLQATMLKRFHEGAEFGKDFSEPVTEDRLHRRISRTTDHPITEYIVKPDAANNSSWHESATLIYHQDFKKSKYKIGRSLDYQSIEPYLVTGWMSLLDMQAIWTDGKNSEMLFAIENLKHGKNLEVEFTAFKNIPVESQTVSIFANGTFITTLDLDASRRKYKITIPNELISGNQLSLLFSVSNIAKYFNHTKWFDFGMGISELTINYTH